MDIKINGLAALMQALDELPDKVQANVMRGAMRAGAKVFANEIKASAPVRTGRLAGSVKFGARLDSRSGTILAYARAGGPGKKGGPPAFYAHMVEYGTAAHVIQAPPGAHLNVRGIFYTSVHHPGAKKHPFMRPALDAQATAAVLAVGQYISDRLANKYGINVPGPSDPEAEE